jgi:NADH-quinone oxidoreductase subunit M
MFQRVNYGPLLNEKNRQLPDLSVRERWVIWPIVAMAVVMGILPGLFLAPMEPAVARVVQRMQTGHAPVSVRVGSETTPGVVSAPRPKAQGPRPPEGM